MVNNAKDNPNAFIGVTPNASMEFKAVETVRACPSTRMIAFDFAGGAEWHIYR